MKRKKPSKMRKDKLVRITGADASVLSHVARHGDMLREDRERIREFISGRVAAVIATPASKRKFGRATITGLRDLAVADTESMPTGKFRAVTDTLARKTSVSRKKGSLSADD